MVADLYILGVAMTALSGTGDKYKNYYVSSIITSGKNFIKITSAGMGAAKSNETR